MLGSTRLLIIAHRHLRCGSSQGSRIPELRCGSSSRVRPFILMRLTGGNESGVGGDQKFDRVESTTETRAARCVFFPQSHITRF